MGQRSPIVGRRRNGEIFPAEALISRYLTGSRWTFTVMLRDITDQRRAEDNLRFLSEVGTVVADLMHDQSALQRAAERAVPTLGDSCIIDLVEGDQILRLALSHCGTNQVAPRFRRIATPTPRAGTLPHQSFKRFATSGHCSGSMDKRTRIGPGAAVPRRPEEPAALDVGSLLVVPLEAHGRIVGAATFVMGHAGRAARRKLRRVG